MILKKIRLNPQSHFYEAVEAGISFQIDPALHNNLKNFFQDNPFRLISYWYHSLNDTDKEKVVKSSAFK